MPFKFEWLCELLEELDANRHKHARSTARVFNHEHRIIRRWYDRFSHRIERTGPAAVAFLSCLLPERRPDRVYGLQHKRLSQVFGRALGLGASRVNELNRWAAQDGADFPECVERVMRQCENQAPTQGKEVTLEEVHHVLDLIAAQGPCSATRMKKTNVIDLLAPLTCRLHSTEAKWLVRMMLKRYHPVQIPEYEALHGFHFMLPNLLAIQASFEAAVSVLAKEAIRFLPARPEKNYESALHVLVSEHIQPRVGVMIRRQPYHKARSIKNCCNLAMAKQMSVERKYDGEYCQIHIDMSKKDPIQIFSKSGKNSTSDRLRLRSAIEEALRVGRNGCRFRRNCVIEGELLVWSSTNRLILPFHKIRKHVKHGGYNIGTANDSPMQRDEHLMVAFYDILLLDDQPLLNKAHQTRRQHLKAVLHTTEGRAILGERTIIDFRSSQAHIKLREVFAKAITQRWEGLVLKSSQDPYFTWGRQYHGIKLKKDYISSLGDSADLCIVGGRRDAHIEAEIGLGSLRWTSFYVGAVCNLEDVRRYDMKPKIKIIDILTYHSMPQAELLDLNRLGQLKAVPFALSIDKFEVEMGHSSMNRPTDLFSEVFIVEIMGAGYDKPSNAPYYTLRFPRKTDGKVRFHLDRTLLDTVSFSELQTMAENSLIVPRDADSQEDAFWIERLTAADGRRQQDQSSSQATSSARTPTSAPAVSLSPISPHNRSSQLVFVRPDTEEPETQQINHVVRANMSENVKECERRKIVQASPSTKSLKRSAQILGERLISITSDNVGEKAQKKRCLDGVSVTDDHGIRGSEQSANAVLMDPSRGMSNSGSRDARSTKPPSIALHLNDSNTANNRSTLCKSTHYLSTKSGHGQNSLPTPESEEEAFSAPSDIDYFSLSISNNRAIRDQPLAMMNKNAGTRASAVKVDSLTAAKTNAPILLTLPLAAHVPLTSIANTEATYTFSIKAFVQQIRSHLASDTKMQYHVILIQRSDIRSVIDTISLLAANVEQHILGEQEPTSQDVTVTNPDERNVTDRRQRHQQILNALNDHILVFDYDVLNEISAGNDPKAGIHDKHRLDVETLSALDLNNGRGKDAALFIGSAQFVWRGARNLPPGKNVEICLKYNLDWAKG